MHSAAPSVAFELLDARHTPPEPQDSFSPSHAAYLAGERRLVSSWRADERGGMHISSVVFSSDIDTEQNDLAFPVASSPSPFKSQPQRRPAAPPASPSCGLVNIANIDESLSSALRSVPGSGSAVASVAIAISISISVPGPAFTATAAASAPFPPPSSPSFESPAAPRAHPTPLVRRVHFPIYDDHAYRGSQHGTRGCTSRRRNATTRSASFRCTPAPRRVQGIRRAGHRSHIAGRRSEAASGLGPEVASRARGAGGRGAGAP